MAEKLRCGVIGVGAIGLDHLLSLTLAPRAAAVAIAETNAQRARDACDRFKIPRSYTDYHELLDQPDIDAVIIALPNACHTDAAIEALKARKHILIEKPMTTCAKDAARILETAKKMRRTVMVAQNFRFKRETQIARMAVERGDLGEIYHARCFFLRRNGIPRIGSWFTRKDLAGGGCTYDIGSHLLDACLHILGDFDVVSVCAHMHAKFGPRGLGEMNWGKSEIDPKKTFDVEDNSVALLKLKKGATVVVELSWAGYHDPDQREYGMNIQGTSAGLSLYPARLFRNGLTGHESIHLTASALPYPEDRVHHFVNCVIEGKRPMVTMEESLHLQQILDAIYASAQTGKEVRLKNSR